MILTEQAAFNYLTSRKEALYVEINSLRSNLKAEIEKTKKRLDNLPPAAYTEANRLIAMYQDILKRLEGFGMTEKEKKQFTPKKFSKLGGKEFIDLGEGGSE